MNHQATSVAVGSSKEQRKFGEPLRAELENVCQTRTSGTGGFLSLYGVLCLSLGFMVFAWGTNYKLSLYKAGHETSPAKVCTRGSDAAKNAVDHAAVSNTIEHAFLSITVLFSAVQGPENYPVDPRRDEAVNDRSPLNRAPILYLRPPPYEGLSLDLPLKIRLFGG